MKFLKLLAGICIWGVMIIQPVFAQNYEQMREEILQRQAHTRFEIEQLNTIIQKYSQQLGRTNRKYEEIFEEFQDLERVLALQQQKIAKLQTEQSQIEQEITVTENKQVQQEEKLEELIENYKKTLRYLYKNGRTSRLALILAAESLNQMVVRNYYLKKFETYREKQVAEIKTTQEELTLSKEQLNEAAIKNDEILDRILLEKQTLTEKKEQQQGNIRLLRQDREQVSAKLQESQQQKAELNNTLTSLIEREEEMRAARRERIQQREAEREQNLAEAKTIENENARAQEIERYNRPIAPVGFISDERLAEIESAFASQKGELSWPVESHTISEHFGRNRHPVYGTYTRNLGIEIVTDPRIPVRVVHPGQVFAVQPIAGYGDVVFVSHGNYKTAYGNLSSVIVQQNSILEKGEVVGYSGDENSIRGSTVFFMLRGGDENLDPENWLRDN